ncbi:MAG: hypothetical protein FWF95_02395 [Syntrophorhabdaceae bacterium]|nr:hypothetical protein [Syntrophorhabdaceae bacterium]
MQTKLRKNRKGQGLTEYIIITALVAIAAIGIVNIFGNQLRHQFNVIVKAMAGSSQAKVENKLLEKADKETNIKNLSTYGESK